MRINYFLKYSVTQEQATVTLIYVRVDREPDTDIIEVRGVNVDGTPANISREKYNDNCDTNEIDDPSYVTETSQINYFGELYY